MKHLPIFILVLFFSDLNKLGGKVEQTAKIIIEKPWNNLPHNITDGERVEDAIGMLVTSGNYQFGDKINIYNIDGKLIKVLVNTEEYQVIALKCIEKTNLFYKVQLKDGSIGMVSRQSKKVKFQTWEEHILSLFSIGFNERNNPLRNNPSLTAPKLNHDKDEFYFPKQIKGEWLQLKYGPENKPSYGWLRWKSKGKLIIEFFYFA